MTPYLLLLCLCASVRAQYEPIVFPNANTINNPTCFGSRLDKVDFVQNMYVQYAEFMTEVPTLYEFHTCFWMRLDETVRTSTALNYAVNNNTNNDVITLQYVNNPQLSGHPYSFWTLIVNNKVVYKSPAAELEAHKWSHHCHSFNGRSGYWSTWFNGRQSDSGINLQMADTVIPGGGVLVTAQHQETLVDGMDRNEGIIGGITLMHVHSRALENLATKGASSVASEVRSMAQNCKAADRGDIVGWLRTSRKTYGGVLTSTANQQCGRF